MRLSNRFLTMLSVSLAQVAAGGFLLMAGDPADDGYEKANDAYEAGEYGQATRLYQQNLDQGHLSEELFYNLGNAHFKQGEYGDAALGYRRALILNPRMPEPRQNLRTLRNRVGLLDFEPEGIDRLFAYFRENEITATLYGFGWLSMLSLSATLFARQLRRWRPLLIVATCVFAALAGASFFCLRIYHRQIAVDQRAVVTVPDTVAQTGPVPDAKTVIELPPGSEVRIVTDSGPWQYVDIPGDLRGWVKTEALTPLWPPSAGNTPGDRTLSPPPFP